MLSHAISVFTPQIISDLSACCENPQAAGLRADGGSVGFICPPSCGRCPLKINQVENGEDLKFPVNLACFYRPLDVLPVHCTENVELKEQKVDRNVGEAV